MSDIPVATSISIPNEHTNPIGIIQFVHGMCEHKGRYKDTIEFFTNHGFICAISDLRGHGENVESNKDLGYFGKHGDLKFVNDIHEITKYLKTTYPNLPYTLIGHSMGSLIVRNYIKKYDNELDGLIVIGSPSNTKPKSLAKAIIKILTVLHGEHYRSKYINKLVVGAFSARFAHEGNPQAWLATDKTVWEEFNQDNKCGFIFTLNGFDCLMNLMIRTYSKRDWIMKNPSLPITFLSGEHDACMINRLSFDAAVNLIKKVGYTNVHFKLYEGRRHEVLNDFDKEAVYNDILMIINKYV